MAIQNRRGKYADFNPGKAVAGEWLIVQEDDPSASDGAAAYIAFKSGQTKRVATYQDMVDNLEEAVEEATAAAAASATLSESYAKGGTNSRAGEETDNAKYYKEQANSSANSAAISKDAAEAIAQSMSAQSGVSGTIRIDGVLYATYCFVENGIPYTRLSEIVDT